MASEVGIVNRALAYLGEKPITLISDASVAGQLAQRDYADVRDEMLQGHPWNFAIRRASLAEDTVAPVWGFSHAYPLPEAPTLCLRVLSVADSFDWPWKVEGRRIVTDLSAPLQILFIQQITDPNQMPPLFRDALSRKLAWAWAETITGSGRHTEQKAQEFSATLSHARSMDGQEGTLDPLDASEWLDARA